ncbi:response regulator [Haliovirga abyssi]|uniref:Response regulator n=1 Tax=Haliovirga abyssi TaxID=2996794 RepID=A0AAU9E021_9FUSO|nr:response regulator [Haliovirga abyssi]BDU49635.1 response regulator [Haliovirga abyssi]
MKIMIVDDSEMTRNFHAYILRTAGFEVIDAVDGADALDKLYRFSDEIKLVLTDLNMPIMDGYTFIKKVREDKIFDELPIGIITTIDEQKNRDEGYEAGVDFYLVKPTEPSVLIESIKMVLGGD